ncbi:NADH:flavin oxidoreductase/NADH oxidase family protein [Pseudonocardiaceae bacterium YIM PH 21723]|nr:NADH:flavin oxidoreductase/NADH oxidase family protein [Pseudonocardiaceae bacterium YIM PH 21723]
MSDLLSQHVTLPCGAVLGNRIAKSGMSEQLGTRDGRATDALRRLYATWTRGGAGLLITGNAVIDRRAIVEPGNIILDDDRGQAELRAWTAAVHERDTAIWMQINHPGRVQTLPINHNPVAPSAIREPVPGFNLRKPRELTGRDIQAIIRRFARTARLAVDGGFDGVQIHAAHGYLLSQFLSPLANVRTDQYGGDAAGRRRLLLEVVTAVREAVGPAVPIGVKLNSKDFQYGGFQEQESLDVAKALADAGIDLLEISGGNYAAPAQVGMYQLDRSEAYFRSYAEQVRAQIAIPIMLTGGIRSRAVMEDLVEAGIDVIGIARPMAVYPDYPERIIKGEYEPEISSGPRPLGHRGMDGYFQLAAHADQLHRIADGRTPAAKPGYGSVLRSLARLNAAGAKQLFIPK